jgi:preprotein translocase subunit Sec63
MNDPYETLGVTPSATDKEIKDAFKKLARKFIPDLHPDDKEAEGSLRTYWQPRLLIQYISVHSVFCALLII